MRLIKTKSAQECGQYIPTKIDAEKKTVDFRIIDVGNKCTIHWNGSGIRERVTERQLEKLKSKHSWCCDF